MKCVIRGHYPEETYWIDGVQVDKPTFDRECPDKPLGGCASLIGWKPLASEGAAVHPDQVREATLDADKKGVPTHFLPDGRPVFESRSHRARYLRAYGFYDRQAGYGDPAKGSYKP